MASRPESLQQQTLKHRNFPFDMSWRRTLRVPWRSRRFQKGAEPIGSSEKFGRSEVRSGHDGKYQDFIWTALGVTCAAGNLLGLGLGWSIKRNRPVVRVLTAPLLQ